MKIFLIILSLVVTSASLALAHEGHDHATGVVKERMVLMTTMGERLLAISKRLRANQLAQKITRQFPAGSTQCPTAAKPLIWQQLADFNAKAKALETESEKLINTDATDGPALRAQFRAVAFACDGCHESYRVTKE
jgi:cytochrome c556